MADLTLAQRFGKNAILDADYNSLIISLDDLTDFDPNTQLGDFTNGLGLNISGMTEANKDDYASRIFWALLQLSKQNQPESNTDDTVSIYFSNQGRSNTTRNGVAQIGYRELVTGYKNDQSGLVLDPDELGSNNNSDNASDNSNNNSGTQI